MSSSQVDPVILGGWQLAAGHGRDTEDGFAVLEAHYAAGFRTLDCADIYTGVEDLIGAFARTNGLGPTDLRVHTKLVPDLAALATFDADAVERAVDRSCERLGREALDLVQLHWWDDGVPGHERVLEALHALAERGRVHGIGLTNVSTARLRSSLELGVPIASVQVQASILDRRALGAFADLAARHGVDLLAYGSVAGGLLSDRYLGADDVGLPDAAGGVAHENRSLTKYRLVVEELGGWPTLQSLLAELRAVADGCGLDVAGVASAWTLAQPRVRACIVGVRSRRHVDALVRLREAPPLGAADLERLEAARRRYPEVPGDVYALERDRSGRHGRIMKYGLNAGTP